MTRFEIATNTPVPEEPERKDPGIYRHIIIGPRRSGKTTTLIKSIGILPLPIIIYSPTQNMSYEMDRLVCNGGVPNFEIRCCGWSGPRVDQISGIKSILIDELSDFRYSEAASWSSHAGTFAAPKVGGLNEMFKWLSSLNHIPHILATCDESDFRCLLKIEEIFPNYEGGITNIKGCEWHIHRLKAISDPTMSDRWSSPVGFQRGFVPFPPNSIA